jgi:thiol-disulfide isomerase/thioredoxin
MNSPLHAPLLSRRHFALALATGIPAGMLLGCAAQDEPEEVEPLIPFVYRRLPPLMTDGWINDGPLTDAQLRGRVIVVDCFASWCGPCALAAPALVQLYLKYRFKGVRFLGLTSEGEKDLEAIIEFAKRNHTDWPIGYGASPTLQILDVNAIPRLFVVGKDGMIRWDSQASKGSIERAIRNALAEPDLPEKKEPVPDKSPADQPM